MARETVIFEMPSSRAMSARVDPILTCVPALADRELLLSPGVPITLANPAFKY
jgi:hypothetical protein